MKRFGQLWKALVLESLALVLLFWLAFGQPFDEQNGDAPRRPTLSIQDAAPAQARKASQRIRETQQQIEVAARTYYETAFRVPRPEFATRPVEGQARVESLPLRAVPSRQPNAATIKSGPSAADRLAQSVRSILGAPTTQLERTPFKGTLDLRR